MCTEDEGSERETERKSGLTERFDKRAKSRLYDRSRKGRKRRESKGGHREKERKRRYMKRGKKRDLCCGVQLHDVIRETYGTGRMCR